MISPLGKIFHFAPVLSPQTRETWPKTISAFSSPFHPGRRRRKLFYFLEWGKNTWTRYEIWNWYSHRAAWKDWFERSQVVEGKWVQGKITSDRDCCHNDHEFLNIFPKKVRASCCWWFYIVGSGWRWLLSSSDFWPCFVTSPTFSLFLLLYFSSWAIGFMSFFVFHLELGCDLHYIYDYTDKASGHITVEVSM